MSICTEDDYVCTKYWTAGQRIDPATESDFVWKIPYSNGTIVEQSMPYTEWEIDQPSFEYDGESPQSCIVLYAEWGYNWNDQLCSNEYCLVCEVDP